MFSPKRVLFFLLTVSIIANGWLYYQNQLHEKQVVSQTAFHKLEKKYPYLSKRILSEYQADILINFLPLRSQLWKLTKPYRDSFAFYFEYLPTGTSIGINEKSEFSAASLFKIPIVMAYYHKKERLGINEDPVVTIQENQIGEEFGTLWKKGAGAQISLDEAIRRAIIDSDNTAIKIVSAQVTPQDFDDVYEGLDIDLKVKDDTAIITSKHYSSILKALFYSSVLTREDSNKILALMTETAFSDKLPAGVPKDILVAHKIGILRKDMYMDCGIVYVPRRPYSLCMVSTSDEKTARERMIQISHEVYKYVSRATLPRIVE